MSRRGRTAVLCAASLFLLLLSVEILYLKQKEGGSPMQTEPAVPPGTLAGVTYSHTSGMVARVDFSITLSPQAILKTSYYPALEPKTAQDEDWYHPTIKENVPITPAQWTDVEQIVLELYPLMKPVPERRYEVPLPSWLDIRDGGDTTDLILTWDTEDGIRSTHYSMPNDRRIYTLIALLQELADPIGREIPRFDPPELIGFYIDQSGGLFSPEYSFQFTQESSVVYEEDAPYILYARFTPPGRNEAVWCDWTVPDAMWDDFAAFAREIGLENQPDGRSKKLECTLYYSDGKQTGKTVSQETAKQIQEYFTELALRLLEEQSYHKNQFTETQ